MDINTIEVIERGMKCLSDNLGADETEVFISTILRERFDYTEWRKSLVDSIDTMDKLDEFVELSKEKNQFNGNSKSVI